MVPVPGYIERKTSHEKESGSPKNFARRKAGWHRKKNTTLTRALVKWDPMEANAKKEEVSNMS